MRHSGALQVYGRSVRDIADYLGIKPSTYFRRNVITRLENSGLLKSVDKGNGIRLSSDRNSVFLK